jgi:hypothetical protein
MATVEPRKRASTPSRVRDQLESRVRKLASTYSVSDRVAALDDIIRIASNYRDQLQHPPEEHQP